MLVKIRGKENHPGLVGGGGGEGGRGRIKILLRQRTCKWEEWRVAGTAVFPGRNREKNFSEISGRRGGLPREATALAWGGGGGRGERG